MLEKGNLRRLTRRDAIKAFGAGTLGILFAACGGTPQATPSTGKPAGDTSGPATKPAPSTGKVTVVFSALGDAQMEQPVYKALADTFNAKQDKVTIQIEAFPEGGYGKVYSMLEAKESPDIIRPDDDMCYFVSKSGAVHDLTDYFKTDFKNPADYFSFFFQELHADGKNFTFDANLVPELIYYNVDHFKEAGITAPTKWADAWEYPVFLENARKLSRKKGDFVERYAAYMYVFEEVIPYSAGVGAYNRDQTKCTLDDPKIIDVFKTYVDLTKEKLMVPPGENPVELFNSGQLSMMSHLAHQGPIISPDVNWKWMPIWKFKKYAYSIGGSRAFNISKYGPSKNPDAAWEFLKFWATEEGSTIIAKAPWGAPPLKKAFDVILNDPRWKDKNVNLWAEQQDFTFPRDMTPMHVGPWMQFYRQGSKLNDIKLGKLDPATFLKDATAEIDATIKKENWKHIPPPFANQPPHDKSVYVRWFYLGSEKENDPRK